MHPKTKLTQVVQEIFAAEAEYEFLKQERKKYEAEIRNKQNAGLEWKRANIPFYDECFGNSSGNNNGGERE